MSPFRFSSLARLQISSIQIILILLILWGLLPRTAEADSHDADVIIVGAGISGLCAAIEAAEAGADVLVVDMWSMFGGHAVMASGVLCLIDTPVQREAGIQDSIPLAAGDFHRWGEDASPEWVKLYTERSREWIFDWLSAKGIGWDGLFPILIPGNSVNRLHMVQGRGVGLVTPLFRECSRLPNIRFRWNTTVNSLIKENGQIAGVTAENIRTGEKSTLRGLAVILATGGFQNDLDRVRANWPDLAKNAHLLKGAGINAVGSGLDMAEEQGAKCRGVHGWLLSTRCRSSARSR